MPLFNWSNDLKLDIKSIDEQHLRMVDVMNQLYREMSQDGANRPLIGRLLEELLEDAYEHFICEEELFYRYHYPHSKTHLAEHDAFTAVIMELLQKFEAGQSVSLETLDFLKEWLNHHLKKVDQDYGVFLKQRGVA